MSDTPRTQNAFAIANLHQNKRMKAIHDEMCQLERELAYARKQRDTLAAAAKMFLGSKAPFPDPRPLRSAIAAVKGGSDE